MSCFPCFGNFMPIVSSRTAHRRRCEKMSELQEQLEKANEKLGETVGLHRRRLCIPSSPSPIITSIAIPTSTGFLILRYGCQCGL